MTRVWKKQAQKSVSLKSFLKQDMGLGDHQISRLKFMEDGLLVNGKRARVSCLLKEGDEVQIRLEKDEPKDLAVLPWGPDPKILYEDEDLLVIDKPAGILSHPGKGHYRDTAANRAAAYLQRKGKPCRIRLAGRLDMDTSGILIFTRNQLAAARLARQREQGMFAKEYLALAAGRMSEGERGEIDRPLRKMPQEKTKMEVCQEGGLFSLTRYRVLKTWEEFSLLSVQIATGRTHQIRVHLAWTGHPLLGDSLYGKGDERIGRAALHAWKVHFLQPFTGEKITLQSDIPEDMMIAIRKTSCHNSSSRYLTGGIIL
ncbi:MAG TPA: RluA family pseudouridine synthase [Candidatus Ruminococcus avistercoris]|nr:RluA family pseudouridine synthase [Candidatus Ruminococcus avistercoris]